MHNNEEWDSIHKNQKPLDLYAFIEICVMKQTGDEYPPCNDIVLQEATCNKHTQTQGQDNADEQQWLDECAQDYRHWRGPTSGLVLHQGHSKYPVSSTISRML